jgi:hypothetical protein
MIEYLLFAIVLFFIAVLFYKQANEEFQILQLEERFSELPTLYAERSPIVMSGFQTPNLGSQEDLGKRPQIMNMLVRQNTTLRQLLASSQLPQFQFPLASAKFLAKESGLSTWFEHHLFKKLLPSPYTEWVYSFNTSLWPDHRGLFKTTAFQTVLMPTQGTASVKLLLPKMVPYLPTKWKGRQFSTLSLQDTPLLNQIQFIEIRIRKGNLLFLPAHLIVDIESLESSWIFIAEIHHPISALASLSP